MNTPERNLMPLVDRTLPYDELVLVYPDAAHTASNRAASDLAADATANATVASATMNINCTATSSLPSIPLPDGYRWCAHPEQHRSQWSQLMVACGFPYTANEAQSFWDVMETADPAAFAANLFFILDADNNLAATCGLWPGAHFDPARWRLHWVMCAPEHQGHGLAKAACLAACEAYSQAAAAGTMPRPLYVVTEAQSWAAIRLYEKLGFVPYEGATCKASAEENHAAWRQARGLIKERYGFEV